MSSLFKKCIVAFVFLFMLASCVENQQTAEGGIGGTGISSGPINGFGSIIVNGIHFDVSQAQVWMNGVLASEDDLKHGMVVTVYGDTDESNQTGVATKVVYNNSLRGRVDSVDSENQRMTVLGQLVIADELTVFDGQRLDSIFPGMTVTVSGIFGADGELLASYVSSVAVVSENTDSVSSDELGSPTSGSPATDSDSLEAVEIVGVVASLDGNSLRFSLGTKRVNYSEAMFVDMQRADLHNGLEVLVEGRLSENLIVATQIKSVGSVAVSGENVSLNGLITAVNADNRFSIQNVVVEISEQTVYQNGDANSVVVNSNVLVAGEVNDAGVVIAKAVGFRPVQRVRIAAPVDVVDRGSVTLAGVVRAEVKTSTLMLDRSAASLRIFSLQDVAVGDRLIVYGYQSIDGIVLARLERVDSLEREGISGPVGNVIGQPVFDVLGVTVDSSLMPNADALFAEITAGDRVVVTGDFNGSVLTADDVVIQP